MFTLQTSFAGGGGSGEGGGWSKIRCMLKTTFLGPNGSRFARCHSLSRQQVASLSQSSCVSSVELTYGRGGAWARSQILRKPGPL
jgi:hypothetical protein